MSVLPESAHVKTYARLLVDRMANPNHYPDMNDGTVVWADVYSAMRSALVEDNNMANVMCAGLTALSGYDPWGGECRSEHLSPKEQKDA